jgi:hypothetical protein
MTSAKELLAQEIEGLSEEDARDVLALLKRNRTTGSGPVKPKLTREELIKRAAGHPGIRVPDPNTPPFQKFEPVDCAGTPASELLIADRR